MPSYQLRRPRHFLVYVSLAILWLPANARFYEERFKALSDHDPWGHIEYDADITQDFASSEYSPSYARFPDPSKHSAFTFESYSRPKEWLLTSASKRVPLEDKSFKKIISPFYTITDNDSQKYKDSVMKSGIPYCQEIKRKRESFDGNAKDSMICHKCKNPKNGATYEQCSYVSKPSTDSSNLEETVIEAPSGFRSRRSNSDEYRASDPFKRRENPYRFSEKLFSDASEDVPAEYRNKDEECEKVVKDTMVCMVCKNSKSNAKYEQCSYVRQPSEKRYAYTKSSSFKNPDRSKDSEDNERRSSNEETSETKPVREHGDSEERSSSKRSENRSNEGSKDKNCKEVERGTQTCTVCKDPDTGGNYEKCSYTYQPDDKLYKYSASKSFGYPSSTPKSDSKYKSSGSDSKNDKSSEKQESSESTDDYKKDYTIPESYFKDFKEYGYHPAASESSKSSGDGAPSGYASTKSESERIAESMDSNNCEEVQRDSMTCRVCKDPKTGTNSEQCSYKHQPSDKNYSYSKSRSFGSAPEDKSYGGSENNESYKPYSDYNYSYFSDKKPSEEDSKRESSSVNESKSEEQEDSTPKSDSKKDEVGFYDAYKKKAEIQKFVQEFQKEDRSNCKKMMRNKMTCYQCVDEHGFQKEECAFITDGDEKSKEVEEPSKKVPRSISFPYPLEPEAVPSENVETQEKVTTKSVEETEKLKEAQPYEYVSETKPVFDKVLGITLPAYMLTTSEHEEEFDRIAASDF